MAKNREPILKTCKSLGLSPATLGVMKETTRNMCRNLGEGCPILTLAEATETQCGPAVHMAAVKA